MRIEHLYYLVEIAKTKSITLSAEHLFISQQGLSQAIQKLEGDLDVALLRRSRQGVSLTEAGILAVEKAQEVIRKYEELIESVTPYSCTNNQSSTDKLSISATPYMSNYLPQILDLFRKQHPAVTINIEEQKPDDILTKLQAGYFDVGLVNLPEYYRHPLLSNNSVLFEKIRNHEFIACVAKSSPLAKKIMLKKSEIIKHPLVAYNLEPYLETLNRLFGDLSKVNIIVKTNSREIYQKTVLHSKAIGVTSLSDYFLFNEKAIVAIPIKDSLSMSLGWLTAAQHPLSSVGQDLLTIYKTYMMTQLP